MKNYNVKAPDGSMHVIQGPDGASDQEVIAQAQKLFPQKPDWQGVVKRAVTEAALPFRQGTMTRDAMTNPVTQAKMLPPLMGIVGGASPVIGGATLGTVAGRQLSNLALRAYGRPEEIPSGMSQGIEAGISALGDIAAIPAIKRNMFGKQIGAIEEAQGVPPPQDIPSLPKPVAGQPVSGGIDAAVDSVKKATKQGAGSPVFWKQIKDQIDAFYEFGKDSKLGKLDKSKLKWLSNQVQEGLNNSIPGRAIPANALAKSQFFPNMMRDLSRNVPNKYKLGGAIGGAIGVPIAGAELIKKLLGSQ